MIILIPLNGKIFMILNDIRKKKVKVTDTRVKLMNEILAGIRVIKYYAWEMAFSEKVEVVRDEELQLLKQLAYVVAIGFTLILMSAPIVQPILIFFTYIKLGNTLDAATAFTTISLFNVMQFPFAFLPMGLAQYSQVCVFLSCFLFHDPEGKLLLSLIPFDFSLFLSFAFCHYVFNSNFIFSLPSLCILVACIDEENVRLF